MKKILNDVNKYYSEKIIKFGPTPLGVDWKDKKSQFERFKQISKILSEKNFSINDIGCGYGIYLKFLKKNFKKIDYTGYDLSKNMIDKAINLCPKEKFIHIVKIDDIKVSDYSVASGIFNVKMKYKSTDWISYCLKTLDKINLKSKKGFSFNMLTKYSEKKYMKSDLYYADPLVIFDYCKKNFSKKVSLIHDYDLFEFTILVKK